MAKRKNITTTQLALMTAAAVISLRGLPMMAQEELTMFFYIFFATFLFLIPAALVGAELGSAFAVAGADATTRVVFAPAVKSKNRVPFDNFRAESLTR